MLSPSRVAHAARRQLKRLVIHRLAPLVLPEHVTTSRRGLRFRLHLRDDIQFGIFCGYFERHAGPLLASLLRPGSVCADIGANIGYWTLAMSRLAGDTGKVYAFEPDPAVHAQLEFNVGLNRFAHNVTVSTQALSNTSGPVSFHRADVRHHSGWGSIERYADITASVISVSSTTFDHFWRDRGIGRLDLVKIDVEGHEPKVLDGMRETLKSRAVRALIVEINAPRLFQSGSDFGAVVRQLHQLGYDASYDFNGRLLHECLNDGARRSTVCSNFLFTVRRHTI